MTYNRQNLGSFLEIISSKNEEKASSNVIFIIKNLYGNKKNLFQEANEEDIGKFKTRITNLIQSKKINLKWLGIEILKVSINLYIDLLKTHGLVWLKILNKNLNFSCPSVIINSTVLLIKDFFLLSAGKSSLSRDLIIPNLPNILTSLFKIIENKDFKNIKLLQNILSLLNVIIVNYSNSFRPYLNKFKVLLWGFIGSENASVTLNTNSSANGNQHENTTINLNTNIDTNSNTNINLNNNFPFNYLDTQTKNIILNSLTTLHFSAPKGNSSIEWAKEIFDQISLIKLNSDCAFSIVEEEYYIRSNSDYNPNFSPNFQNITQSVNNIILSLNIISTFLVSKTKERVRIPLGDLIDFSLRIINVSQNSEFKQNISNQDLKSELLQCLPELHFQLVKFLKTIILISGQSILPFTNILLNSLALLSAQDNINLHEIIFLTLIDLSNQVKLFTSANATDFISEIVLKALAYLETDGDNVLTDLSDSIIKNNDAFAHYYSKSLISASENLIIHVLKSTPGIDDTLRNKIDRTIILLTYNRNTERLNQRVNMLTASSLYPGFNTKYSILPLAAKACKTNQLADIFVHPRFPPSIDHVDNLLHSVSLPIDTLNESIQDVVHESTNETFQSDVFQTNTFESNKVVSDIIQSDSERNTVQLSESHEILVNDSNNSTVNNQMDESHIQTTYVSERQVKTPDISNEKDVIFDEKQTILNETKNDYSEGNPMEVEENLKLVENDQNVERDDGSDIELPPLYLSDDSDE